MRLRRYRFYAFVSMAGLALTAACGGSGAGTGTGSDGAASGYPQQTIRLIFPFAAGSPGDLSARALAKAAEKFTTSIFRWWTSPERRGPSG